MAHRQVAVVEPDKDWLVRFASAATHDLRSPLRGIVLEVDLAREHAAGSGAYESHLDAVEAHAWRLGGMLDDLLAWIRVGAEGAPVRVALQPVVERVLTKLTREGHATALVGAGTLLDVLAHEGPLEHALHCVLGSVVPVGTATVPRVQIEARRNEDMCHVEIVVHERGACHDPFGLHEHGDFRRITCAGIVRAMGGEVGHAEQDGTTVYRLMLPLP